MNKEEANKFLKIFTELQDFFDAEELRIDEGVIGRLASTLLEPRSALLADLLEEGEKLKLITDGNEIPLSSCDRSYNSAISAYQEIIKQKLK